MCVFYACGCRCNTPKAGTSYLFICMSMLTSRGNLSAGWWPDWTPTVLQTHSNPLWLPMNESAIFDVFSDTARQRSQLIIGANALIIMKKPHASLILIFEHQLFEVFVGISNKFQRPRFGITHILSWFPVIVHTCSRKWAEREDISCNHGVSIMITKHHTSTLQSN